MKQSIEVVPGLRMVTDFKAAVTTKNDFTVKKLLSSNRNCTGAEHRKKKNPAMVSISRRLPWSIVNRRVDTLLAGP